MNCYQIEEKLQTVLDNRRALGSDAAIAEHLGQCQSCADLAAAFEVAAASQATMQAAPIVGLTDQVLSQVFTAPTTQTASATRTFAWQRWGGLAMAASLLLVVSFGMQDNGPQVAPQHSVELTQGNDTPNTQDVATRNTVEANLAGRDMWFRTGRGLASMAIAHWQADDNGGALESESAGNQRFLDRAVDSLREMLPGIEERDPGGESNRLLSHEQPLVA